MSQKDQSLTGEEASKLLRRAYALKGNAEAKELYAAWAKTYDHTMLQELGYITPANTANLLSQFVANTAKILDIGTGTGLAGLDLAKLGFDRIDGLDYSPEMLEVAKHRDVYEKLIEADLNQPLSVKSETYDGLICTGTFTHAHVGAGCLPELFRVLKPQGFFACTVHKEVWEPAGFGEVTKKLVGEGKIKVMHFQEGPYYSKSTEPEGWYIVWQKIGKS